MMTVAHRIAALCLILVVSGAGSAIAQEPTAQEPTASVAVRAAAYDDAQRHHLWRIAAWGSVNALGGAALLAASRRAARPARWGFGLQATAWGLINMGIATAGLLTLDTPPTDADALLRAERSLHDILLVNLGLNVAYAGVGTAMVVAGYQEVNHARAWRGHGSALIVQGLGLLVFDAIAFVAARARLADLIGVSGNLSAHALPAGVGFTLAI